MSAYSIEELIARWKKEQLTVEQVIGQLLLLVQAQEQRLRELGRQRAGESSPPPKRRNQ